MRTLFTLSASLVALALAYLAFVWLTETGFGLLPSMTDIPRDSVAGVLITVGGGTLFGLLMIVSLPGSFVGAGVLFGLAALCLCAGVCEWFYRG